MTMNAKTEMKAALDRAEYWNREYGKTDPPPLAQLGFIMAFIIPPVMYTILPAPAADDVCEQSGRLELLLNLQIIPAVVAFYYIVVSGLQRIPSSFAAAHDPASAYFTGSMPMNVIAANRAFNNTLEQYMLLLATSATFIVRVPCDWIDVLPAWYMTWAIARVMYLHGYISNDGSRRMIGFPSTVMPTFWALCYCVYSVFQSGSLY